MNTSDYEKRGVSSDKEDVHKAISAIEKGIFPNAFCKILPDYLGNRKSHCNIVHADGAGTKAILAYLYWKETGDISVFRGIAQDSIVMNLDDLACVGAVNVPLLVSGTIGRNKFVIPGNVIAEVIQGTEEFLQKLRDLGIKIHSGGGETADLESVRTLTVDHTMTARMLKHDVVLPRIQPEDLIVGLASSGQSGYEAEYNSGIGSNGLTSARHDLLYHDYAKDYPEIIDPNMPEYLVYRGNYGVDYSSEEAYWQNEHAYKPINIGKLLLSPTRTYAPVIKKILETIEWSTLDGMIHCSGGGQTKVMNFIRDVHIIKDNLFEIPPVFEIIREEAAVNRKEMYKTYNMGHRMEIYVSSEASAKQIIDISKGFGVNAKIIGHVEPYDGKKLTIKTKNGEFEY